MNMNDQAGGREGRCGGGEGRWGIHGAQRASRWASLLIKRSCDSDLPPPPPPSLHKPPRLPLWFSSPLLSPPCAPHSTPTHTDNPHDIVASSVSPKAVSRGSISFSASELSLLFGSVLPGCKSHGHLRGLPPPKRPGFQNIARHHMTLRGSRPGSSFDKCADVFTLGLCFALA